MSGPRRFATLALGAMLLLGGCDAIVPPDPATGTSVPTIRPQPTPSGASPSPVAAAPELPVQPCCRELPLPAGPYALPGWLGLDLRLEAGDGWGLINDSKAEFLAFGRGDNGAGTMDRLVALLGTPEGTTDDEVVEHLESMQTVAYDGPTGITAVAGYEADEMIGTAMPNPGEAGDPEANIAPGVVDLDPLEAFVAPGFRLTTATAGARVRIQVIEVGEDVLIAYAEAPPADADAFFADVDDLLATLEPTT